MPREVIGLVGTLRAAMAALVLSMSWGCGDEEQSGGTAGNSSGGAAGAEGGSGAGASTGGGSGASGQGGGPPCPAQVPPSGLANCDTLGLTCTYDEACGPTECECRRESPGSPRLPQFWCTKSGCPGTDCPTALPTSGDTLCDQSFIVCRYSAACGQVQCECVYDPPRAASFYQCTSC